MRSLLKDKVLSRIRSALGLSELSQSVERIEGQIGSLRTLVDRLASLKHIEVQSDQGVHRLGGLDYAYAARTRDWENTPFIRKLSRHFIDHEGSYTEVLSSFLAFTDDFARIAVTKADEAGGPHWVNGWFPGLDALALYSFLVQRNPATFIEVGSGNSTAFAGQAVRDHELRTRIISIDPHPRKEIDAICDEVIRQPLEDVDLGLFKRLTGSDLLFIDSSHRSFQSSDVTVFFVEVLSGLPAGLLFGMHDILLPRDYWGGFLPCFYNEQYLLASYLAGGAGGDEVVLPVNYVSEKESLRSVLDPIWNHPSLKGIEPYGGSFWMRKA